MIMNKDNYLTLLLYQIASAYHSMSSVSQPSIVGGHIRENHLIMLEKPELLVHLHNSDTQRIFSGVECWNVFSFNNIFI